MSECAVGEYSELSLIITLTTRRAKMSVAGYLGYLNMNQRLTPDLGTLHSSTTLKP